MFVLRIEEYMEQLKHMLDGFSGLAVLASALKLLAGFFSALPTILSIISMLMAITWYCIRFYEYFQNKRDIEK